MTLSSFFWLSLGAALGGLWMWLKVRRYVRAAHDRAWDAECETRRERHRNRVFTNMEPYRFASLAELVGPIQEGE